MAESPFKNEKLVEKIPWKANVPFVCLDYWLQTGAAYALYKIPAELYTLFEVTDSRTIIKNYADLVEFPYAHEVVLIGEIPPALLVRELINLCDVLYSFVYSEETNFEVSEDNVNALSPFKGELQWLADTLVPFFIEGIISKKNWPLTLVYLEKVLAALEMPYQFGAYTAFGYLDLHRAEPLNDGDFLPM